MYSIWQDAGIRARVAATKELHASLIFTINSGPQHLNFKAHADGAQDVLKKLNGQRYKIFTPNFFAKLTKN